MSTASTEPGSGRPATELEIGRVTREGRHAGHAVGGQALLEQARLELVQVDGEEPSGSPSRDSGGLHEDGLGAPPGADLDDRAGRLWATRATQRTARRRRRRRPSPSASARPRTAAAGVTGTNAPGQRARRRIGAIGLERGQRLVNGARRTG